MVVYLGSPNSDCALFTDGETMKNLGVAVLDEKTDVLRPIPGTIKLEDGSEYIQPVEDCLKIRVMRGTTIPIVSGICRASIIGPTSSFNGVNVFVGQVGDQNMCFIAAPFRFQ